MPDSTPISNIRGYAAETHHGQEHVDRWHRVLKTLGAEEFPGLTTMTSGEAQGYADMGWDRWIPVVAELKYLRHGRNSRNKSNRNHSSRTALRQTQH